MKTTPMLITVAAALLTFPACAAKREVPYRISPGAPVTEKKARFDYSTYAKIPDTPTGIIFRTVQRAIPYTRERSRRGNWAGSGWGAGLPVDAMDEVFRRHDIVYAEVRSSRTMHWADAACIEALHRLDPHSLAPEAIAYRDRCTGFFTNPAFNWLGKPAHAFVFPNEARDCPFQSETDVRELFGLQQEKAAAPRATVSTQTMVAARKPVRRHAAPARHVAKAGRASSRGARRTLIAQQGAIADRPSLP